MSPDFHLGPVLPEFILAVGALVLLMVGALRGERSTALVTELAIVVLGAAFLIDVGTSVHGTIVFEGAFLDDAFGRFMKGLALLGSLVTLVMSIGFLKQEGIDRFEYPVLILLSTLGMLMLISANSLIALYLGFELMSLALYVLAAFHRDNLRASEAGLKYFVLGALSSGMLLYGASLIYGYSGTVLFSGIASALQGNAHIGVVFGLVFLSAGLAFKMSTVPFHMWTPDVYEGAPTPVTAFFATAPKMAAVAITVRIIITAFPGILHEWQQIIIFISIASMALGSFAAIGQTNFKRLMAYSAIGHMGFALVGLAPGTEAGVYGVLIYLSIYLVMTLGTFAAIMMMRRGGVNIETTADLAGLGRTRPAMAFFLAMLMFSLAGIPPLAGFFAKFYVFQAAIQANLYALAVLGVLSSVVAAYYYLRIVKMMYFDEPTGVAFDKANPAVSFVLGAAGLAVLLFWVFPAPIVASAAAAARSLF
ncbi:NADH-quinone oxidoreductase subunit NuoN [Lichenihabitans sp. PAMC28606]|uniref:NADH-quinone oxidoreductase subunit NuoN n=1 Tax=Lichenihabitans sp. PAMC28606 TaxID=2880932 RepID=UPI001D0B9BF7|nr:NADH-quinone oxidoreductase subunit NuoN [Lichenihabitans sp. PAMC28606]UDL95149.1 NADH-quinone oxidoreductase subunit NuoN [Lichenihabitans sp. PAMC28606]